MKDVALLSFILLVLLLLNVQTVMTKMDKCPRDREQQVSQCLQPMVTYAGQLQAQTGAMQFPVQGAGIFEQLCHLYSDFAGCVRDINCGSISVEAIDASYGYMCGDGYKLFQEHVDCFAGVEANKEYISCKNAATNDITLLQEKKAEQYFEQLCTVMSNYLRCSHPIIVANCNQEAWNLVARVTEDSLKVTLPTCNMRPALV